jgi:Short C-terminal domain
MAGGQEQAAPAQPDEQAAPAPTPAPAAPAPPAPASAGLSQDALTELKQLSELHESGVLTDEEFAQQKAKILGS